MIVYIDHPLSRGFVTDIAKLRDVIDKNIGVLTALVVMDVEEDLRDKLSNVILDYWLKLTGNAELIERIYVAIDQLARGIIDIRKFTVSLIKALMTRELYIEDLYLINIFMKSRLGLNVLDLDLIVVYENPQSVVQGLRLDLSGLKGVVLSREVTLTYKVRDKVRRYGIKVVVARQTSSSRVCVVDMFSNGLYPYTPYSQHVHNNGSLADPVLTSYMLYGVRVRSRVPDGVNHVIILSSRLRPAWCTNICDHVRSDDVAMIVTPDEMREHEVLALKGVIREHKIVCEHNEQVNIVLHRCLSEARLSGESDL